MSLPLNEIGPSWEEPTGDGNRRKGLCRGVRLVLRRCVAGRTGVGTLSTVVPKTYEGCQSLKPVQADTHTKEGLNRPKKQ